MRRIITLLFVAAFAFTATAQEYGAVYNAQNSGKKLHKAAQTIVKQNNDYNNRAEIFYEDFSAGALPSGWQNVDNAGNGEVWEFNNPGGRTLNSTTAANGFASFDSDNYGNGGGAEDADLITPAIDCSGNTTVKLSFEHYFYSGYEGAAEVSVSGDNGATWTSLGSWADASTENAELAEYDISTVAAGQSQVLVKFNWTGNWSWYWLVDDVTLFEPAADDLAVTNASPSLVVFGDDATPMVTVTNAGAATQDDFTVSVAITDGYTSTYSVTGAGLASGESATYTMDDVWSQPAEGEYTMTATVTLAGDADNSNNEITGTVNVIDFSYTEGLNYGFSAYDGSAGDNSITTNGFCGNLSSIGTSTSGDFFACGDYIDGIVVGIENGTNNVYYVNGDGSTYNVGSVSGAESAVGLAYDQVNDIIYLSDWDGTNSTLYTVDPSTFAATEVGVIEAGLIIGIAADDVGDLYGISMATNKLVSIDATTGAGTNVGDLGVTLAYAQDMGADKVTGKLYGTLYQDGPGGGWYEIDKTTGEAVEISTFPNEVTMCAVVGPMEPASSNTTFIVDATQNDMYSGFELIGSWDVDGYYDDTWNGGAAQETFVDDGTNGDMTAGDGIWTTVVSLMSDCGVNTWEWGVNDQDGNNIDGNWTFTVENGDPQTLEYQLPAVVDVTFNVDMNMQIDAGTFVPGTDVVNVTGTMFDWAEPGTVAEQEMADGDDDGIYTTTVSALEGDHEYKYFMNTGWDNGEWNAGNNRIFTLGTDPMTLNDVWGGYYVNFLVTDGTDPLEGATVEVDGPIVTKETWTMNTDVNGEAHFVLADGDYNYTVSMTGYNDATGTFNVMQGDVDVPEIAMALVSVNTLSENGISIYPNPSNGQVFIEVSDNYNVEVIDITGKVVKSQFVTSKTSLELETGMYFVRFSNSDFSETTKVIVK